MHEYEIVFIIKGSENDEAVDALVTQLQDVVTQQGAEIVNVDKWGRRKLAYEIEKQRDGCYVLFHLKAEPAAIKELERRFRMLDTILRFLTVRLDEEYRRARRRAIMRARRKGTEPDLSLPAYSSRPRGESAEGEEARDEGEDQDDREEREERSPRRHRPRAEREESDESDD